MNYYTKISITLHRYLLLIVRFKFNQHNFRYSAICQKNLESFLKTFKFLHLCQYKHTRLSQAQKVFFHPLYALLQYLKSGAIGLCLMSQNLQAVDDSGTINTFLNTRFLENSLYFKLVAAPYSNPRITFFSLLQSVPSSLV